MAHMIPSLGPAAHFPESREGDVYRSLSLLPDDYWVVHSYKTVGVIERNIFSEHETDFLVFNPKMGILVIEVKAGQVRTVNGEWRYSNGDIMRHGGPYRQADAFKWRLSDRFEQMGLSELKRRCKLMHAVWFPSLRADQLGQLEYSAESAREITLCGSDLADPGAIIERIMSYDLEGASVSTSLTEGEAKEILEKIVRPEFNIVPTKNYDHRYGDFVFASLLDEQIHVLDFLQEQKTATINGAAGTGKTLIAVEHARRIAKSGKVLFLCFNALLKDDLKSRLADEPNVDVYTISGYASKVLNTSQADYKLLASHLDAHDAAFGYRHVVIDEGQDFGNRQIEASGILETLQILTELNDGTMYFFYDKRQLVQGVSLPDYIADADCKMTLYRNCRNTGNIGQCSLNAISDTGSSVKLSGEIGNPPQMKASSDIEELCGWIDSKISSLQSDGIDDIVILTCKTIASSILSNRMVSRKEKTVWSGTRIPIYTCRTFKGMEADAVILIDVDPAVWDSPKSPYDPKEGLIFYTGASRAKHELLIALHSDEDGCNKILAALGSGSNRRPFKKLANVLGVQLV